MAVKGNHELVGWQNCSTQILCPSIFPEFFDLTKDGIRTIFGCAGHKLTNQFQA
jgi:hypothetical protein